MDPRQAFSDAVDAILESGHWSVYKPTERVTIFKDTRSSPGYDEMDPGSGTAKKNIRKRKRQKGRSYSLKL